MVAGDCNPSYMGEAEAEGVRGCPAPGAPGTGPRGDRGGAGAAAAGAGTAGVAGAAGYAGRDTDTDARADYDRQYGDDTALDVERDRAAAADTDQRAGFFGGDRDADATTAVPTAAAGTDYDRDRTADYDRDRAQAVDGERTSVTRHEERLNVAKERREDGKARLMGDVADGVDEVASWLSPNPGGVGPMTRAMLLSNVVDRAEQLAR